jgi:hypothetical protein
MAGFYKVKENKDTKWLARQYYIVPDVVVIGRVIIILLWLIDLKGNLLLNYILMKTFHK